MPGPTPLLSPLVVCDTVIRDRDTGKPSLIGVFSWLGASVFPIQHPSLSVNARAVDAQGTCVIRLELVRLDSMGTIGDGQAEVTIPDRLGYYDIVFELNGLVFPAARSLTVPALPG